MQTLSGQNTGGTNSPLRKFTLYVILGFALTGLISGFAFGGLTHSSSNSTASNSDPTKKHTPVAQITNTVTPTPTVQPVVALDPPAINLSAAIEKADGTTTYSISIQAKDKQHHQAVQAPDITCKAWLVQKIPDNQILNIDTKTLKAVNTLNNTITGTVNGQPVPEVNGLGFDQTTPSMHLCDANGQMVWKYTITPGTPPGDYDIVVLTDWRGVHWNWSWDNITIQ